jgi:hypothetical protein
MALIVDLDAVKAMSRAQRTKLRRQALAQLNEAQGALSALDGALEYDFKTEREKRPASENRQKVVDAFRTTPATPTERAVLQVLFNHPAKTSAELSVLLGWEGQSWHMHFGEMCRRREPQLWPATPSDMRQADFYSGILAFLSLDNRWIIWPEVAKGLSEVGILPSI